MPNGLAVTGSVQLGNGPTVQCEGKNIDRPPNGWNSGSTPIHHAYYDSVSVYNGQVTCIMGAD